MTPQPLLNEELRRIRDQSLRQRAEIRERMTWVETHRRELWERMDRLPAQQRRASLAAARAPRLFLGGPPPT